MASRCFCSREKIVVPDFGSGNLGVCFCGGYFGVGG